MEKLLNAGEVAELLGLTEERVYALVREEILPAVRLGRRLRFSPRKIEEFIENGGKSYPGGWRKEA